VEEIKRRWDEKNSKIQLEQKTLAERCKKLESKEAALKLLRKRYEEQEVRAALPFKLPGRYVHPFSDTHM
jgi:hypothetical protein